MTADDHVERLAGEGKPGDIELDVDIGPRDVGSVIALPEPVAEKRLETWFGSEVKNLLRATIEHVCLPGQKEPDEAMPLQ
jgi:hypothetical protein